MKTETPATYADSATPTTDPNTSSVVVGNSETDVEQAYAEKNPKYFNLTDDITSRFAFYGYQTLSIKPFDVECLKKIYRSMRLDSSKGIVEAISSCVDPDKSAFDLTVPDFWSLMIWQRINSYRKTDFVVTHHCSNPEHQKKVNATENLEDDDEHKVAYDTLYNSTPIKGFKQLKVKFIDEEIATNLSNLVKDVSEKYGIYLYPPTMADTIEIESLEEYLKSKINPDTPEPVIERIKNELAELEFTAKYATHISRRHGTLKERIELLEKQDPDFIEYIDEFMAMLDYGIKDTVQVKCAYCNHGEEIDLTFDLLTFFPGNK